MNRNENERLIEQYLSGTMSPAAEQDFFIRVAMDSNLRQTLKAYRVVESALQKHRNAVPSQHLAARERLLSSLEAARAGESGAGRGASAAGAAAAGASAAGGFRWSLAAVAVTALTVGALVLGPLVDRNGGAERSGATQTVQRTQPDAGARPMVIPSPSSATPSGTTPAGGTPSAPSVTTPASTDARPAESAGTPRETQTAAHADESRSREARSRETRSTMPHETAPRSEETRELRQTSRRPAVSDEIGSHGRAAVTPTDAPSEITAPAQTIDDESRTREGISDPARRSRTARTRYSSRDTIRIPVKIELPK